MTPVQLHNLRLLLEGLAAGTIDAANVPLMAQFALEGVIRAQAEMADDHNAVLAPVTRLVR